jgi:heme exporter protein C
MALTFMVCLAGIALLFATLCKYELTAKHTRAQVRALRRRLSGESTATQARRPRSAAPTMTPAGSAGPVATMSARAAGRSG